MLFVAEKYNEVLKKLKEISEAYEESWLYNITDTMEGSEITPDEGLKAVRDDGIYFQFGTFDKLLNGLMRIIHNDCCKRLVSFRSAS